ncbi:MAG: adenylyl-sulfate reductase subunit alpha [Eubacterium sp.]|nr:adenylyl-sulfate reductase subunit alpha [Eubacterium sp.]
MEHIIIKSDVLIIGGGTAGCYAAVRLAELSDLHVVIAEKANIERSGCLAAGVNALNAYISEGYTPMDYVRYASRDAGGIVREDLLLDISVRLNAVTHDLERKGLTILKDADGNYVTRGWRNLKINGENIKPILAEAVRSKENVAVYNHVNITDYRYDASGVKGAYGFSTSDGVFYEFQADAVLIATGGAAGLYRPNNPGPNAHQMWYCPFNTGAGYCMGILAGAEMTTFEMRFIALRCRDTIAPTGTIAQGIGAGQINASAKRYEAEYGYSTAQRLWGTVSENMEGRGPCYLETKGITEQQEADLYRAYLNMAPLQTLKWIDSGRGPSLENTEIEGTEPYIVGGHTASGYWVGRDRSTTLAGLFAAGDVAGGAPQKYVTGALAEGAIAAEGILNYLSLVHRGAKEKAAAGTEKAGAETIEQQALRQKRTYERLLEKSHTECSEKSEKKVRKTNHAGPESEADSGTAEKKCIRKITPEEIELALQKTMDAYAGGIQTSYRYSEARLDVADREILALQELLPEAYVPDPDAMLQYYEVRERLVVARVLIAHLRARRETRWRGFQENTDYPGRREAYECYINSVMDGGTVRIIKRDLIKMKDTER